MNEPISRCDWDPVKNRENLRKHGVRFETASLIFEDPWIVSRKDMSHDDAEERFNRQAVSASEISGLPERKGYLKSGNFIVPLTVARLDLPIIAEGFIPRQLPPMFPVRTEPKKNEPKDDPSLEQEQKRQTGQGRAFFK